MNREKIIELVKVFRNANYKDFFGALIINERVDYFHDINDLQDDDIKCLEELYDNYMKNDSDSLINNDLIDDLVDCCGGDE